MQNKIKKLLNKEWLADDNKHSVWNSWNSNYVEFKTEFENSN